MVQLLRLQEPRSSQWCLGCLQANKTSQAKSCPQSLGTNAQQRKHSALCSAIHQFRRNERLFPYRCLTGSTLQGAAVLSRMALALSRAPSPAPVPAPHLLPDTFGKKRNHQEILSANRKVCVTAPLFSH